MDRQETFVFRLKWREAIAELPDEVRLEIYEGILDYISGLEPQLSALAKGAFLLVKFDIDKTAAAYAETCKNRAEAGRKGAEARWGKMANDSKNSNCQQMMANAIVATDSMAKMANDGKNGKNTHINYINNNIPTSNSNILLNNINKEKEEEEKEEEKESATLFPPVIQRMDYEKFVQLYNTICKSYRKVTKITDERRRHIKTRFLSEMQGDWQIWINVLTAMEKSKFMRENAQKWANFDWLIKNGTNWVKVLEGNYNGEQGKGHQSNGRDFQAGAWSEEDDDTTL